MRFLSKRYNWHESKLWIYTEHARGHYLYLTNDGRVHWRIQYTVNWVCPQNPAPKCVKSNQKLIIPRAILNAKRYWAQITIIHSKTIHYINTAWQPMQTLLSDKLKKSLRILYNLMIQPLFFAYGFWIVRCVTIRISQTQLIYSYSITERHNINSGSEHV